MQNDITNIEPLDVMGKCVGYSGYAIGKKVNECIAAIKYLGERAIIAEKDGSFFSPAPMPETKPGRVLSGNKGDLHWLGAEKSISEADLLKEIENATRTASIMGTVLSIGYRDGLEMLHQKYFAGGKK